MLRVVLIALAGIAVLHGPSAHAEEEPSKRAWSRSLEATLLEAAQLSRPVFVYVKDTE